MGSKKDKREEANNAQGAIIAARAAIIVALIGLAGTLIGVVFDFQPFERIFDSKPTGTPTLTPSYTPTETFIPTLEPSFTPTSTFTPTETLTPTFTFTPIPPTSTFTLAPGLPIGMQVKVIANPSRGRPPLKVNLDARDSYLRAPNGEIFECRNGACKYTWYLTVTGGQPEEQTFKSGSIQLTFDRRGTYYINVYICHGSDNPTCASGGAVVIVE